MVLYESIDRGMIYTDYDDLAIRTHTMDSDGVRRQIVETTGGETSQSSK